MGALRGHWRWAVKQGWEYITTGGVYVCVCVGGGGGGSKKLIGKDLLLVIFMVRCQCCSAFLYNSSAFLTENLSAGHAGDGCSCCRS